MNKKLITLCACALLALALLVGGLSIMTRAIMRSRINTIFSEKDPWYPYE